MNQESGNPSQELVSEGTSAVPEMAKALKISSWKAAYERGEIDEETFKSNVNSLLPQEQPLGEPQEDAKRENK